jgi:hypothetical protein
VPIKMMDAIQRSVARHFQRRQHPQDGAAFPRPESRTFVSAADGGTMGLHRPGWRLPAGGLRDSDREEIERAYDRYDYDITNAWRRRDAMPSEAEDEAETQARASAIRKALLSSCYDPADVEIYLNHLHDDDLFDLDVREHVQAFEERQNGRDTRTAAVDRKIRLEKLYRARDAELEQQWRRR